jgi:hypothetical protein
MNRALFILIFLVLGFLSYSQDILYLSNGDKLSAKITEINPTDVKYKDFTNLNGPTYVISNSELVLIQYSNGTTQVINSNPRPIEPKKESPLTTSTKVIETKKTTLPNLYYMNSNLLSINALALTNGDVTLIYDRELFNCKMSVSFLGGYNFNSRMGVLNSFISDTKDNAKKNYDVGLGINYMPKNTKRVQYFIGVLGKYMSYNYKNVIDTTNNQKKYADASAYQLAIMLTNGWVYRISPFFNFKIFGSIGVPINSTNLQTTNSRGNIRDYTHSPKIYLGYCFGYRF